MYEEVKSFEKGFIIRQLKNAHKAVAAWPAWMRREADLLVEVSKSKRKIKKKCSNTF